MEDLDTGILLNKKNISLYRKWFVQMTNLIGIKVLYRTPKEGMKNYTLQGELDAHYNKPEIVGCIYDDHPTQKTMRKLGWDAELNDSTTLIHVPYDLQGLQAGCLFIIPSGLDNTKGRVFKVLRMSNIAVYPSSITCELGPVIIDTVSKESVHDFKHSNFNMLDTEEEDYE